jgi:hypothetical protein
MCCICRLPDHKKLEQRWNRTTKLQMVQFSNKLSICSETYSAAAERCWRRGRGQGA